MNPRAPSLLRVLTAGCLFSVILAAPAPAQEWTRFRGPNGSGIGQATVPVRWTEKDHAWKSELPGVGHSSPVLWGERLFITSGDEKTGKRFVLCLDAVNGHRLWLRAFNGARHPKHTDNSFASATPAVDERHVYVCWATPHEYLVQALDHDGKEVWQTDLGPFRSGHGFGSSPIVHGGLVIVPNDQDGPSTLVALDGGDGKVRWKVPRRSKASYATPCVYQPRGRPAELILTSYEHGISSIDPKTGRVNWEIDVFDKGHVETPTASPLIAGDLVLGLSGWLGVKMEVVAVRPDPREQGKPPAMAYRLHRGVPLVPTPLVRDDLLFLWSDGGIVTCASARTGEVFWQERVPGSYYGSPVCVGKHLYCISREGDVIVLAAAKQFELLGRNPLGEGSHSTPAVAGGKMYLRTFSHLLAIGGKGK